MKSEKLLANSKKRKLIILLLAVHCLLLTAYCLPFTVSAEEWQELPGDHFIVYFTTDENFAEKVSEKAEEYYRTIAIKLGYARYSEFWLWDDRVKIYIYPDRESYLKGTSQPEWSNGMADYVKRYVASYSRNKQFTESVLPHEIAHLIFRDFVGFKGEIPIWLDEGVAQWAEESIRSKRKAMVLNLYANDKILPIDDLMKIDVRRIKKNDRIYIRPMRTRKGKDGILFLDAYTFIVTYYIQSFSLVDFLIDKYGSTRFTDFCRQLRDGKKIDEALSFAYSVYLRNLDELDNVWRKYLEEELENGSVKTEADENLTSFMPVWRSYEIHKKD